MITGVFKPKARPEWVLVRAFACAIVLGGVLLCLPISSSRHVWTDPLIAFFTATSATCVTGLSVVDIGTFFSPFGQVVILGMIQAGGLGIMTLGTFLLVMVGRRLGMQNEFVLIDSLGYDRIRGLPSLLRRAVFFTVLFEAAGALFLAHRLATVHHQPMDQALYSGAFHAISAFCNAGFSLYPDNLASWRNDPALLLSTAVLIVLGGLGFLVLYDLSSIRFWRRNRLVRGRLSLHTKIVMKATLILIAVGWVVIGLCEWNNLLAPLPAGDKLVVSLFHSITARTAGFNVIDMGWVRPGTLFFTMLLMFIGAGPCSTAGGIKVSTLAVMLRVMLAMIQGKPDVESHGRTIPNHIVREAQSIFVLAAALVGAGFGVLLAVEPRSLGCGSAGFADGLLFEAVSAFGTVGLSTGVTPALSVGGKLAVMLLMFVGRVGPLTLALVIGRKDLRQATRLPEEDVIVG